MVSFINSIREVQLKIICKIKYYSKVKCIISMILSAKNTITHRTIKRQFLRKVESTLQGAYHEYLTSHLSHFKKLTSHLNVIWSIFYYLQSSFFTFKSFFSKFHIFTFKQLLDLRMVFRHSSHLSYFIWLAPLPPYAKEPNLNLIISSIS